MMDGERIEFRYESASANIKYRDGQYNLTNVFAANRGLGHGTRLMELVTEYADGHDIPLILEVRPYDSKLNQSIMALTQLVAFYAKFGFTVISFRGDPQMQRLPSRDL